jgi:phage-related protein
VLLTLVGILTAVVGVMMILYAGLQVLAGFFEVSVGVMLGFIGVIALVVAAVAVLAFFIIKYHRQIWDFIVRMWNDVKDFVVRIWNDIYNAVAPTIQSIWNTIVNTFTAVLNFWIAVWNAVWSFLQTIWNSSIVQFIIAVVALLVQIVRVGLQFLLSIWLGIWNKVLVFVEWIGLHIVRWFQDHWGAIFATFIAPLLQIWHWIITNMPGWFSWIKGHVVDPIVNIFTNVWGLIDTLMIQPIMDAWDGISHWLGLIYTVFTNFLDKVRGIIDKITGFFSKLNPLSRSSPPLTEQTKRGFRILRQNMFSELDQIHNGVRRRTLAIQGHMKSAFGQDFGAAVLGGFQTPVYASVQAMGPNVIHRQTPVSVTTQEIDPRYHAAELGWELDRRAG